MGRDEFGLAATFWQDGLVATPHDPQDFAAQCVTSTEVAYTAADNSAIRAHGGHWIGDGVI